MRREQIIPEALQLQIDAINAQELIIAQIDLPEITAMPDYNQVIRIQDSIINLTDFTFIPKPKRILIHKTTGEELDLNLKVPEWNINRFSVASLVNAQGKRVLVETNYYNDEDELVETKQEPVHVNTLQYLTLLAHQVPLPALFGTFLQQYVEDEEEKDFLIFTRLKNEFNS